MLIGRKGCRLPGGASSPSKLWDMLMEGRSGYGEMPTSKFHAEAFYHPNADRPGSINSTGGYFINEDTRLFDNSFFGINNVEAKYMDPQQRKLLEVVYECFESAGVCLENISGANVGCYVGNFLIDFQIMQNKDLDSFHRYSATGLGSAILANRVSHVFNLRGPSLTLDTACSSSLYCLHLACTALESGECDAAVVAGANLIQSPEMHLTAVKAGILSETATCHTFDLSADGYGRAEAVGSLYLKRLKDAVRDNDPIRSVIRGTAINRSESIDQYYHILLMVSICIAMVRQLALLLRTRTARRQSYARRTRKQAYLLMRLITLRYLLHYGTQWAAVRLLSHSSGSDDIETDMLPQAHGTGTKVFKSLYTLLGICSNV